VRRYVRTAERLGVARTADEATLTDAWLGELMGVLTTVPTRPHGAAWAACGAHEAVIRAYLERGVRLTKVGKLLRRQGVVLPYSTLRRFAVAVCGFGRTAPTVAIADCAPGAEVQLDTGWMTLLAPDARGRRRRFRAWIFSAVFSRYRFVYPCCGETTASAIEACEVAWAFFGGVFAVLIPDNTKAIIDTADPLQPLLVTDFLEYAQVAKALYSLPTRYIGQTVTARADRALVRF
jgi:hypothetical protein